MTFIRLLNVIVMTFGIAVCGVGIILLVSKVRDEYIIVKKRLKKNKEIKHICDRTPETMM